MSLIAGLKMQTELVYHNIKSYMNTLIIIDSQSDTKTISSSQISMDTDTMDTDTLDTDTMDTSNILSVIDSYNFGTNSNADFTDISYNVVTYDRNYQRSKGALGQIIASLKDMELRSQTPDLNNIYQIELYPHIRLMCSKIVDRYSDLVSKIDSSDYVIFGQYFNGVKNNGDLRETRVRNEKKAYKYSQMKETLKSIKDRLYHITTNAIKRSKDITRSNGTRLAFRRVVNLCDQFSADIAGYIAKWERIVKDSRAVCSIEKDSRAVCSIGKDDLISKPKIEQRLFKRIEQSNTSMLPRFIRSGYDYNIKKLVI
jgi:hypothetical protein